MIEIFGAVFLIVFVMAFITIVSGFWKMRGMTNTIFTLAEQEMKRKLGDRAAVSSGEENSVAGVCSHCGNRVADTSTQCPNCGAGLP